MAANLASIKLYVAVADQWPELVATIDIPCAIEPRGDGIAIEVGDLRRPLREHLLAMAAELDDDA